MAENTGKAVQHFLMGLAHVFLGRDEEGDDGDETTGQVQDHAIESVRGKLKARKPACCTASRVPPLRRPRR